MIFFDHAPGSPYRDDFEIAHSAYRLRKSHCFLRGTVTDLHHLPQSARHSARRAGDRCTTTASAASATNRCPRKHTKAADCVACHMPKRRTQDVIHAVMTDHYIQRRPPAGNLLAPLAERQEFDAKQYRGAGRDLLSVAPAPHTGKSAVRSRRPGHAEKQSESRPATTRGGDRQAAAGAPGVLYRAGRSMAECGQFPQRHCAAGTSLETRAEFECGAGRSGVGS